LNIDSKQMINLNAPSTASGAPLERVTPRPSTLWWGTEFYTLVIAERLDPNNQPS